MLQRGSSVLFDQGARRRNSVGGVVVRTPSGEPAQPLRHAALALAVRRRAAEVTAVVVTRWLERHVASDAPHDTVVDVITRTTRLGTQLVARFLNDGGAATPEELRQLGTSGALTVLHHYALTEVTKNCLTWRDALLRVVEEEGARLEIGASVLAQAATLVRSCGDSALVLIISEFDVERQDLRDRLAAEHARMTHLALHDPLTGLPNRTLLLDRLTDAVAHPAGARQCVAVLYLDLDGFKAVNDSYGHRSGDELLVAVAECLTSLVRPSDTVARFGGDEFVIVYQDVSGGAQELAALAERIRVGVTATCAAHYEVTVTVSIGAAMAHAPWDPERLLAEADAAMYASKRPGALRLP